jgi:hypothetical protein
VASCIEKIPQQNLFKNSIDFYNQHTNQLRSTSGKMWNNQKVPNVMLGEQLRTFFEKLQPKMTFEPIHGFPQTVPIDSARLAETHKNFK